MKNNRSDISIVLLTYNGERYLDEVLAAIFNQRTHLSFEVIAVDSGSTDRTLEILGRYQTRLRQIPNQEFGHGRTRNLGGKLASGRHLVYLTQDATPASDSWLENLVEPLEKDDRLAGVYSRQIPRPDCNPCEWRDLEGGVRPVSIIKRVDFSDDLQKRSYEKHFREFMAFSNVSSCVRKDVLERIPFSEKIVMVEDQEWSKRVIEAGWTLRYEARSVVYHSHNHSLRQLYKRQFDYGASYREFAPFSLSFMNVAIYTLYQTLLDATFILAQSRGCFWKVQWLVRCPFIRLTMRYGLYKGLKSGLTARYRN